MPLVDHVIEFVHREAGDYAVTRRLLEYEPYPPDARMSAEGIVFHGDARELWSDVLRVSPDEPERVFEHEPDARDAPRRTSIVVPRELAQFPWEEAAREGNWRPHRVIRRSLLPAGEHTVPLDLPIDLTVLIQTALVDRGWARGLFDEYGAWGVEYGLIALHQGPEAPVDEIVHVVWSSSEGPGAERLQIPHELQPPRLLVMHDVLPAEHPRALAARLDELMEWGVDAVVLAALPGLEAGSAGFFPRFYRDLMHNRPLDECHADAAAGGAVASVLALRDGGEFGLLLGRTLTDRFTTTPPRMPVRLQQPGPLARLARAVWREASGELAAERDSLGRQAAWTASRFEFSAEHTAAGEVSRERDWFAARASDVAEREAALGELDPDDLHRATFRTTSGWITDGGRKVGRTRPLVVGRRYDLHVKIGRPEEQAHVSARFPMEMVEEVLARRPSVTLDVGVFAPGCTLEASRTTLVLPRVGDSEDRSIAFTPLRAGRVAVRIAIYHRNVMLQSMRLEVDVHAAGEPSGKVEPVWTGTDYIASGNLAAVEQLPPAALNLFMNRSPDGTHWIGLFTDDDDRLALKSGSVRELSDHELAGQARELRRRLALVEGENPYNYEAAWPDVKRTPAALARREKRLVELARDGWLACAALLYDDHHDGVANLREVRGESIVSVARCRAESTSVPWAAIYDLPLDTGTSKPLALCTLFHDQLLANEWSDGGALTEVHDLLDEPGACRAQAGCPLNGPEARRTVCPFGFWGFAHQVEQPLQQVDLPEDGSLPAEATDPRREQTSFVAIEPLARARATMGVWPKLPGVEAHRDELARLALELDYLDDREQILERICKGGDHFYYLYCHGELDDTEKRFQLKLGPGDDPQYISYADLTGREPWPPPSSLVVINGCESLAATPEVSHLLMQRLRRLGAGGIVGTEVKVWTQLAAPFGRAIIERMLGGMTLGEAFLAQRRALLRELNPLGLAYSFYAPAALHLHADDECEWCARHG